MSTDNAVTERRKIKVTRVGNSLGLILPVPVRRELGIKDERDFMVVDVNQDKTMTLRLLPRTEQG